MALLTGSWVCDATIVLATVVIGVMLYAKKRYNYWKNKNVPFKQPSFPFGNSAGMLTKRSIGEIFKEAYEARADKRPGERFFGFWMMFNPTLVITDPELVKTIFVKEFMSFHDRRAFVNEEDDPLTAHLFSIGGAKWRNLRAKMTPTFTSGKMKMMFSTLVECSKELVEVLQEPAAKGAVVEVKDLAARFTTDIISSCAFGIKTNSLKDPNAEFREMGRKIFRPTTMQIIKTFLIFMNPELAAKLRFRMTDRTVEKFFLQAVKETMDYRESTNTKGNDFMQLLIQLKNKGKLEDVDGDKTEAGETMQTKESQKFTFLEAAAQAFVFFIAGFETSSTTTQFALYELAMHPEIQDKARQEVLTVLEQHGGQMTYEAVHDMTYLERVVDETLRKYPPLPLLDRHCSKDYLIPGTDVTIEKGTDVQIPVIGFHYDPRYFPEPNRFDPERFTEEAKAKRHHYTYLPFGEGPRNCIGMRFGLMQTKVGLITLLKNFRFHVAKETPIPLKYDPAAFVMAPLGGMHLKITKV